MKFSRAVRVAIPENVRHATAPQCALATLTSPLVGLGAARASLKLEGSTNDIFMLPGELCPLAPICAPPSTRTSIATRLIRCPQRRCPLYSMWANLTLTTWLGRPTRVQATDSDVTG
eukprot:182170-Prorocentrum_minimum.AAC.4